MWRRIGPGIPGSRPVSGDDVTMRRPNTSPELEAYMDRTRGPLDLLALLTLWVVLVPFSDFDREGMLVGSLVLRIAISVVFGFDMGRRAMLAPEHWRYVRQHWVGVLAVLFPPFRIIFSLQLIRSLFRRGALGRFLVAAGLLLLNGAILVYFVERGAPNANIETVGESVWWAAVTVATVGYGDFYPVTTYGRIVATAVMAIGLLTIAVITANVSASFGSQPRRRRVGVEDSAGSTTPGATAAAVGGTTGGTGPAAPAHGASVETFDVADLRRLRDQIDLLLASAEAGGVQDPSREGDDPAV